MDLTIRARLAQRGVQSTSRGPGSSSYLAAMVNGRYFSVNLRCAKVRMARLGVILQKNKKGKNSPRAKAAGLEAATTLIV